MFLDVSFIPCKISRIPHYIRNAIPLFPRVYPRFCLGGVCNDQLRKSEAGDFSVAGTSELRCPGLNLFATPCLPRRGGAAMHCRLQPSEARRGGLRYGATCHSPFSLHAWPCLGFYPWSLIDFCPLFLTNGPLFDAS